MGTDGPGASDAVSVIRDFLVTRSSRPVDAAELDGSRDLLEDGVIDSLSLMVLVDFLGERYGLEFEPDEIVPENFKSLETIAALVDGKLRRTG